MVQEGEVAINYIINANFENNPVNMHFYLDENHTVELPIEDGKLVINGFISIGGNRQWKNHKNFTGIGLRNRKHRKRNLRKWLAR